MEACRLFDLGNNGASFTWSNKRKGPAHVKERLDKTIRYIEGRMRFPEGSFFTLTAGVSDHSPILFVEKTNKEIIPRPFRFHMWFRVEECETLLEEDGKTQI